MSSSHAESQSRLILLLIAGTPVVIILAASWLWYFVIQGNLDLVGSIGTSNNGKLSNASEANRASIVPR